MGESVTEGTILEWAKQVGDSRRGRRDDRRDLHRQGRRRAALARQRHDHRDPRRGRRDGHRRPGHRAHERRRRRAQGRSTPAPQPTAAPRPAGDTATVRTPDGAKVTPVAARVAAAHGVDLDGGQGHRPRRPHLQGRRARRRDAPTAPPGRARRRPTPPKLLKGAGAMLARYMDESRSIPTATSFRTITVTDARRPPQGAQGGRPEGLLHAPDRLRDRPRRDRADAGHGATTSPRSTASRTCIDAGQVNLGIAVDVEKKDGGRTLMVPVIRDAGRLTFPQFLDAFNDLIARARENKLTADDLQGANVSLTNPGGIGTIASVPRLMTGQGTIVATGSIAYPVGLGGHRRVDRRREGDDDDLDLRPPGHPGRRVRPVPAGRRGLPPGRARLLRAVSSSSSARSSAAGARRSPPPVAAARDPRPAASPPGASPTSAASPTRRCCRPSRPPSRC